MRTALQTLLKSKDHRLERRIALALLLGLTLTFVVHFLSSTSIRHLLASDEKVMFNFELDNYLEDLDHQLISLESNLRSYIISDAAGLLGDIGSNLANAREKLDRVTTMASGLHGVPRDMHRLRELVENKLTFSEAVLDSFSRGGVEAAIELVNTQEGLKLRDSIIRITSSLRQLERQNITQTIELNRNEAQEVSQTDYVSTLLATVIVLLALFYFLKSIEYRKTIQVKLEDARQEAERSAQVKEQFAANMSHEIRTPLHAMLSYSEMLTATNLSEEQREYAAGIQISGENLLTIVNDILDFSKMEAGMIHLEQIPFRVSEVWQRLERIFRPKAEAKGLQLTFNSFPQSDELLCGDPTRLNQILMNLIGNAVKFTEEGGVQIWGHLKKQTDGRNLLEIKVSDSGIGIAEDQIKSVYERFRQGEASTSRRFGGTGLGLAIVKQLVELQGGTIGVQSQLGQGSTFVVRVPYERADLPVRIAVPDAARALPGQAPDFKRILIAEDNHLNRRIMALHFQEWGYSFDLAENGREALIMTHQFDYDLIFLDIQMPELDGFEVAQQIRKRSGEAVPIIAITAHAGAAEREKCRRFGINDCIQKPFVRKDLFQLLCKHSAPKAKAGATGTAGRKPVEEEPDIDLVYLLSISNGRPERLQEMAEIFLDQAPKELSNIHAAIQEGDFNRLAGVAHSMQSTVAYMGLAHSLGPLLRELENQAKQKTDQKNLLNNLEKLREQMQRAMDLVRRQIGQS